MKPVHQLIARPLRRGRITSAFLLLTFVAPSGAPADVRVCTYNLLQYSSAQFPTRDPNLKVILNAIDPDIICIQEISNQPAAENFRDNVLNASGGPGAGDPFALATFSNTGDSLDIGLLFRSSLYSEVPGSHLVIDTPVAPRPARRWRLRPLGDTSGASDLYIYGMHLSAVVPSEQTAQAADVRANANTLPAGSAFIYCGDFNIDNTSAGAYQEFIGSQTDNDGRSWDALNPNRQVQNWSANGAFAAFHTQSPHDSGSDGAPGGAAGGGMDDRFDFLLVSEALHDGQGQDYVAGSYSAFGNDGQHFNDDLLDPPVIPEGAAMQSALHATSDHLPVYLDLTDPISTPQIAAPSFLGFPQVLVGAVVDAAITISNPASPPGIPLEYSFSPPPGFDAPAETFQLDPGQSAVHTITLVNTATSGTKMGTLAIVNNSATNPKNVTVIGIVLDHAVPSVEPDAIVTEAAVDFGEVPADTTAQLQVVIHNADVPEFPSRVNLRIDGAEITGEDADRFNLIGFAPPVTGIDDSAEFTVQFDATDAAPGEYAATLAFETHDDSTAVGATALSEILFHLQAEVPETSVPMRGDFNDDEVVDLQDVDPFVAVLLAPESATADELYRADMNENLVVDGLDLQPFVDAILN